MIMDPSTLPHDNRSGVIIGVVITVVSIAVLSVSLRFYTRGHLLNSQIGTDDFLSLAALLFAIATGVSQCVNTRHGLGAHIWDLKGPEAVVAYLKNFYVNIVFYNTGLMFVKLTFLTQYYRVIVLKKFRIICVIAMVLIGTWSFSQVLVSIFFCKPIAGFWDSSLNAKCIPDLPEWYTNAAGNIFSDVFIFILPMPVLAHLNLPTAQKIPLLGIFSLGFFTCAISVIRIKYLQEGKDYTYENIDASSWSITELCSGIICSSLSTLRPLVAKYVPALANKIQRSAKGCYHRRLSSGATDVEKGRKPAAHQASIGKSPYERREDSEDNLYQSIMNREGRGSSITSGDISDGILGLRDTKESLYESKPASPISMTSTAVPVRLPPRNSTPVKPQRVWIQPGVTTTVSTGGYINDGESQGQRHHNHHYHRATHSQPDMIEVTHDIEQSSLRIMSPKARRLSGV
ncbi:hypothetical protein F5Y16DRAFT_236131 [Xylariaceae sp. FL0255]|nr:hypothetical protein F5Y16DRAFT_236131 [Xylariaceae sp. FL0255]